MARIKLTGEGPCKAAWWTRCTSLRAGPPWSVDPGEPSRSVHGRAPTTGAVPAGPLSHGQADAALLSRLLSDPSFQARVARGSQPRAEPES